jgi:hypothetical protein
MASAADVLLFSVFLLLVLTRETEGMWKSITKGQRVTRKIVVTCTLYVTIRVQLLLEFPDVKFYNYIVLR